MCHYLDKGLVHNRLYLKKNKNLYCEIKLHFFKRAIYEYREIQIIGSIAADQCAQTRKLNARIWSQIASNKALLYNVQYK